MSEVSFDTCQPAEAESSLPPENRPQALLGRPATRFPAPRDSTNLLATFRRKIGWRWLLDRIDCFAENCKIGRIWVDVGRDH
jgi:hypothetical protein